MNEGNNLPGVKKKSFALYFNNGEIWCEHLDGIFKYTDIAIEKLNNDYEIFRKPSKPNVIAVNLAQTYCEERLLDTVCEKLTTQKKKFQRVAFVGVPFYKKGYLKRKLNKAEFLTYFTQDFEKAKQWLIP